MKVVVVGGGIVGLSTARELLADGHEVVVVERDRLGGGATPRNAGWVCPSQVGPLAAPGMLRHSVGLLLRPDSPLHLSPRIDRSMARFLLTFARRCTRRHHASAVESLVALAATVDADHDRLAADLGLPVLRHRDGVLCCFTDEAHARAAHAQWSTVERAGGPAPGPVLGAAAMHELEPALGTAVRSGFLLPGDSHLDPAVLAGALAADVRSRAAVVEDAGATDLVREGDRVVGVRSSAGDVTADEVVLAAGAASAPHLRRLGVRVPMVRGVGYSFTVHPEVMPRRPVHLEEAHIACTPYAQGFRVAGTMELSVRDDLRPRRVEAIARGASAYLTGIDWEARTDVWCAPRPVTSDGLPLLGRPAGVRGCVVASGHGMYGVTLAPTTARLVADVVGGGEPPAALRADRKP